MIEVKASQPVYATVKEPPALHAPLPASFVEYQQRQAHDSVDQNTAFLTSDFRMRRSPIPMPDFSPLASLMSFWPELAAASSTIVSPRGKKFRNALLIETMGRSAGTVAACAPQPSSMTEVGTLPVTVVPTVTVEVPTAVPTETVVADKLAGPKPEGQGITLDTERHRWKNVEGQYWLQEIGTWGDLRSDRIPVLDDATNFYNHTDAMYVNVYSTGQLPDQGKIVHTPGYDQEFGPSSGNWFNFSLPTQISGYLAIWKNYPTPQENLNYQDVIDVLDAIQDKDNPLELTLHIPSNAKDTNSIKDFPWKLGLDNDVIFVDWASADPAIDPAFTEINGMRLKVMCDPNGKCTEIVATTDEKSMKDGNMRLAVLGWISHFVHNNGQFPMNMSEFSTKVLSEVASGTNQTIDGIPVKNQFLSSSQ